MGVCCQLFLGAGVGWSRLALDEKGKNDCDDSVRLSASAHTTTHHTNQPTLLNKTKKGPLRPSHNTDPHARSLTLGSRGLARFKNERLRFTPAPPATETEPSSPPPRPSRSPVDWFIVVLFWWVGWVCACVGGRVVMDRHLHKMVATHRGMYVGLPPPHPAARRCPSAPRAAPRVSP